MSTIDIFYQAEGLREIAHLEVNAEDNLGTVRDMIVKKHGLEADGLIFIEDADAASDAKEPIRKAAGPHGLKVHIHRCREVGVSVTFNGETVDRSFTPATTIARVKKWAAEGKFGMNEEEAGEHVLQIKGTHDRPAPNIHVGSLVKHPACRIAFDLVPDERVNGASVTGA